MYIYNTIFVHQIGRGRKLYVAAIIVWIDEDLFKKDTAELISALKFKVKFFCLRRILLARGPTLSEKPWIGTRPFS